MSYPNLGFGPFIPDMTSTLLSYSVLSHYLISPLIFFPIALVSLTDAMVALGRIGASLIAEELDEPYKSKNDVKLAVEVDSDFAWESVLSVTGKGAESKFAALAGKGGTAAAGGREGSQGGTNLKRPTFHQPKQHIPSRTSYNSTITNRE
ncbi:hypothetical protein K443DRAFT_13086 [Laccaria amethystina LaAM-08-1]|uniref:Uncharacterized protein n=1 Tax=Laccaria amethystina LaAM-08-1 TaxID=1095629 RepID=A0A0C9WQ27_9AGAR|nr:hypothetical protein K443DRAFT_13086 [Laccaria amethystina LaAM-08-1]